MEWKFHKLMKCWNSSQKKGDIRLSISLLLENSILLIIDLDDMKNNIFFSLSKGAEYPSKEAEDKEYQEKENRMKELEELFDIAKWGDLPQKEMFKELQKKIIEYFDTLEFLT